MNYVNSSEIWCACSSSGLWDPDASEYRNVTNVYRISLKSLARRYLELHDEIADLNVIIAAIVDGLAPELIKRNGFYWVNELEIVCERDMLILRPVCPIQVFKLSFILT